jgi:hypothetical protein
VSGDLKHPGGRRIILHFSQDSSAALPLSLGLNEMKSSKSSVYDLVKDSGSFDFN